MQVTLIILSILAAVLSAISIPSTGEIDIIGPGLYYVQAGIGYNRTSAAANYTLNMLVSLHSSQSILTSNCSNFVDYTPENHNLNISTNTISVILPKSIVTGNLFAPNLWIDSQNWNLIENAIHVTNCSNLDFNNTMSNLSGILGFGYAANSIANYHQEIPTLSVYITDDLQAGKLFFHVDETKKKSQVPAASFTTSRNWRVSGINSVSIGEAVFKTSPSSHYELAFDLNSDAIALPLDVYTNVMKGFLKIRTLNCTSDSLYLPNCTFSGSLADLPVLSISVSNTKLQIPPQAYVINASRINNQGVNNIILGLKAINSTLEGPNHVVFSYNNEIILGAQVLSYYYAVFTGSPIDKTGTVDLFEADHNLISNPNSTLSNFKWWIIPVILATISIVFSIYLLAMRRNKINRLREEMNENLLITQESVGKANASFVSLKM